jgi:hypothetical protein
MKNSKNDSYDVIFRRSFRHPKSKKLIVAPPGKVFPIRVRRKKKK